MSKNWIWLVQFYSGMIWIRDNGIKENISDFIRGPK